MKILIRIPVTIVLLFILILSASPCGPGYVTPLFDTTAAPENPYSDFAAGRLGIVKPTFRRSVLYAAYRYIAGNGLSSSQQQAMVEVWKAELDNKDFRDDSVDEAVKAWIARRKEVVGKELKVPEIYAERNYGSYDFFPNCTRNAFETATETLSDRSSAYGPSDPYIADWIKAQDQVFENCASGKQTPNDPPSGAPDWLQKDRAYQKAAAEFYSLDYESAKRHFAEIAADSNSPWQETADYLVSRTLIRQASLTKSPEKTDKYYEEAEQNLLRFASRTGKFTVSAERMLNLIKYRRHPKERVSELAKNLSVQTGDENFRQDVIDYNWLLDKFQSEVLSTEEKRKETEKPKDVTSTNFAMANSTMANATAPTNAANSAENAMANAAIAMASAANTYRGPIKGEKKGEDDLELNLYANETSWTIWVKPDATDDEAYAAAEKVMGVPLSDEMKKRVRELRQTAYGGRFTNNRHSDYQGGYFGEEKMTRSLMPDFLRQDDLTDWLFTYQMPGAEAYLYAISRFKSDSSDLWLMTALSKADKSSTGLPQLLEAAKNANRTSPAFPTIAYHNARILLGQGKSADAQKFIDEILNSGNELPIAARNSFLGLKLKLIETLEDFLTYSLRKPFAFDFDGQVGQVEEFIDEAQKDYNSEYNKEGRDAYNAEIEDNFKDEKLWQARMMFDADTIEVFNQHFPTPVLLEVEKSSVLPEYLRERFVLAIWTRSFLLDDKSTLLKVTPELAKYHPDFAPLLDRITAAKTPSAYDHAALFFVLKNPMLSPYIEDGTGRTDNELDEWDPNNWWCAPYDTEYNDETSSEQPKKLPSRPKFLTAAQSQVAQTERKGLKETGDAPKYLGDRVMDWAKRSPADRRVPEALYIAIQANGWNKYGCSSGEELHDQLAAHLKKNFPSSEWTAKLIAQESEK